MALKCERCHHHASPERPICIVCVVARCQMQRISFMWCCAGIYKVMTIPKATRRDALTLHTWSFGLNAPLICTYTIKTPCLDGVFVLLLFIRHGEDLADTQIGIWF